MIKANELRIGNWVKAPLGEFMQVEIIRNDIEGEYIFARGKDGFGQNGFSSIPLSQEILEKCGGEKDDKSVFGGYLFRLNGGEQIRIVYNDTIGWHWPMFGHTAVIVNFLHQFQNLIFLLDGNELDVKL